MYSNHTNSPLPVIDCWYVQIGYFVMGWYYETFIDMSYILHVSWTPSNVELVEIFCQYLCHVILWGEGSGGEGAWFSIYFDGLFFGCSPCCRHNVNSYALNFYWADTKLNNNSFLYRRGSSYLWITYDMYNL